MATQKLNVDTSIVDYLKSTGADSSFGSRRTLAQKYGIANYSGTAEQNVALLGYAKKGSTGTSNPKNSPTYQPTVPTQNTGNIAPITSPSQVSTTEQADQYVNGNQSTEINAAVDADTPPVRNSFVDNFRTAQGIIETGNKPPAPNFERQYRKLQDVYHLDDLNKNLQDLQAEEDDLVAQKRISTHAEMGKPVALNVIEGRVGEQERNFNERIDAVTRQKTQIQNQVKNAQDTIDTMMKYKQLDYNAAHDDYNEKFSQTLSLYNAISAESNRIEDNARANLSILYNSIKDGGFDLDLVDEKTKLDITAMELQAGLPAGFYQFVQSKNPKADVISTTTREEGGNKYVDLVMRDQKTGAIYVQHVNAGKSTSSGSKSGTEGTDLKDAKAAIDAGADEAEVRRRFLENHPGKGSSFDSYIQGI